MLVEKALEERQILGALTQYPNLQRHQFRQRSANRIARMLDQGDLAVSHPIGGSAALGRKTDPTALVQLAQKRAGSHVFDLAFGIAPVPEITQSPGKLVSTKRGIFRHDPPDVGDFRRPDPPALNNTIAIHYCGCWQNVASESSGKCKNLLAA